MANQNINMRVKYSAEFDTSKVSEGLRDLRKQISNIHIGEDLRKQLEQALNKVQVNIPALEKFANKQEFNSKDLQAYQKVIQEVMKDMNSLSKLVGETDFSKFFSEADTSKLKNFEKQIGEVENRLKSAKQEIINTFENSDSGKINGKNNKSLTGVINQLIDVPPDQIENKLNEIVSEAEKQTENAVENFQNILAKSNKVKTGADLTNFLFGKDSGVEIAHGATTRLKDAFNGIREAILSFDQDTPIEDVQAHIQALLELVNDEAFLNTDGKESVLSNFLPPEVLERLKEFQQDIPALKQILGEEKLKLLAEGEEEKLRLTQEQAKFLNDRLQELVMTKQLTAQQAEAVSKALENMNTQAEDAAHNLKNMEAQSAALEKTFGSLAHRIANSISALTVFNKGTQIVRNAISSVKELDAAFTQIAIVSEQTNEQAWAMFDSFNQLAKQYSITTKDLTEGAKLFYQQGLNAADTMKMVEASTVSAALGEVTMTEAANTLTAAIQGYNESAAVAMDYTDKIAMVGAVSAADFNELSTAMEKTASSAYTAGIDFDHLLGYLGKMIEVTREAPANLGTAMKTIIARFEDMKKDPMAILEDGVSANKVEAALATIGIALRDTAGEFRPLQDVMDELGMKWNSLTRNQQAYIATVAAGSRQQSRFLALMNNYDRTLDLIAESQNSAGAAAEQYAIYQDSAAAATARLTAAWEEFYSKIVNSEQIIWVINALEKLVETMSKIGPVATAIGTTVGALGLNLFGKAIIPNITKSLADVASTGQVASLSIGAIVKGGKALLTTFGKVILVAAAVAAAIAGIVWVVRQLDKAFHRNREEAKKAAEELKNIREESEKTGEKTSSLEKLLKKYDELNNKTYRTKEEQEELNNVINEINEISDTAIISINKLGEAHLHNRDAVEAEYEETKKYNDYLAKQKLQKQVEFLENTPEEERTDENLRNAGLEGLADLKNLPTIEENLKDLEKAKELLEYANSIDAKVNDYERLGYLSEEQSRRFEDRAVERYNKEHESNYEYYDEIIAEDSQGYIKTFNEIVAEYANTRIEHLEQAIAEAEQIDEQKNKIYTNLANEYAELYGGENSESLSEFIKNGNIVIESEEDLFNFIDNFSKILPQTIKNIEKYNSGEISLEELKNSLDESEIYLLERLGIKLENDAEEAAKEVSKNKARRKQFGQDFKDLLAGEDEEANSTRLAIIRGDITQKEDFKMRNIAKSNEFEKKDKLGLFRIFAEDDTTLNDLIDDYTNKVADGLYKEADIIKQAMIKLLADKGISGDAAALLADFFVEDYQSEIDKRLSKAEGDYDSAKDIYNKDSGEALTDKEYEFLQGQDPNIDRYIAINEEGEKYLSILGKVVILENARNEYVTSLQNKIEDNNHSLELARTALQEQKNILKDNVDLEEDDRKEAERLVEVNQQKINDLETSNNLLEQQLNVTADIVDKTMSISFKENLSQAQQTYDNINKIGKALGEAKQNAGQLSFATAQSLLALDDAYYQYIDIVDGMVKLDTEGANEMMKNEKAKYDTWLEAETKKLDEQIAIYEAENQLIENYFVHTQNMNEEEKRAYLVGLEAQLNGKEQELNNLNKAQKDSDEIALKKNSEFLSYMEEQLKEFYGDWAEADAKMKQTMASSTSIDRNEFSAYFKGVGDNSSSLTVPAEVKIKGIDWDNESIDKIEKQLKDKIEENLRNIDILKGVKAKLKDLSPAFQDAFNKGLSEAAKGGKEALQDFAKIVDDLVDALEDLDKLLKDISRDLDDISVDYNPFTDLFEAWEHEWDYYYNIKRLIQQIGTQGQFIDNIISSDYASAEQKTKAYHAKIGNIQAQMAANDAYITALRAGMSQTAVELMENYGEYYKVDPNTGQIYQTDKNLNGINQQINTTGEELYNLQKLQNQKQNDLNLEQAKLESLEKEKSAYEQILSTIDSQIDSLEKNEDITVDLTQLKDKKAEIEGKIKVTDDSIDEAKDKIQGMEDEVQDLEVQITLKSQEKQKLEDYVNDMEEKVAEYEEYWETLNSTIAEQQTKLQELTEIQKYYIDTAISTQQELYNAIVEQYQDEINEKKKQYDYLKQLDSDYLASVKNTISEERQARDDSNKQKSYQQSVQRAQLLQMDTSGAFRNDLASLNKEIESQRQELYDDLVDKQVQALEKEIERRHELYDKEVAALEERLAYMQENAILLWDMVNNIVAQGSQAMMATLENTTAYINSNELSRMQQRENWENNIAITYDGVEEDVIHVLDNLIEAGNNYLDGIPEIQNAVDEYGLQFEKVRTEMVATEIAMNAYKEALNNGKTEQEAYNIAIKAAADYFGESLGEAADRYGKDVKEIADKWGVDIEESGDSFRISIGSVEDKLGIEAEKFIDKNGEILDRSGESFQLILDDFMDNWNDKTHKFTGYAEDWRDVTGDLKQQTEDNLADLRNFYDDEGNARTDMIGDIKDYNDSIKQSSQEIYDDFIEERKRYRDELESTIQTIQAEITAAIQGAAAAIQAAADSIQFSAPAPSDGGNSGGNSGGDVSSPTPTSGPSEPEQPRQPKKYKITIYGTDDYSSYQNGIGTSIGAVSGSDLNKVEELANSLLENKRGQKKFVWKSNAVPIYMKGGIADFTGPAWLDGTKTNPERILSPKQTKLFESMVASLEKASNNSTINSALGSSYNIGDINTNINVEKLDNETDIDMVARQVENRIMKSIRNRVSIAVA